MTSVVEAASALASWMRSHGVDAQKVDVILRARDDKTEFMLAKAVVLDLAPMPACDQSSLPYRRVEVAGVRLAVTTLDRRVPT